VSIASILIVFVGEWVVCWFGGLRVGWVDGWVNSFVEGFVWFDRSVEMGERKLASQFERHYSSLP